MKQFSSHTLPKAIANNGMESVSAFLDTGQWQQIDQAPWHEAGHLPKVSFTLAHNEQGIYLKYRVSEQHTLARYTNINDPVYKDSCVEFFISFYSDKAYYNFEFNSIGTPLGGYGEGKNDRVVLPANLMATIGISGVSKRRDAETGFYNWELTLFFPLAMFIRHQITDLTAEPCHVNFYKCGDDLPQPHFLSWAPLTYPYPEFHLPQQFGLVKFI